VCSADFYEFLLEPQSGGQNSTIISSNYIGSLGNASPSLLPGTYNVSVRVSQEGVLGDFGSSCPVTIAGSGMMPFTESAPLSEFMSSENLNIFPNPNDGAAVWVNVSGLPQDAYLLEVSVIDVYGRVLESNVIPNEGGYFSGKVAFNENLPMGMYFIRLSVDGNQHTSAKMIVK
jgi:hypothetical protein